MKRRIGLAAAAAGLAMAITMPAPSFAAAGDAIGTWKDTDTGGITRVYSCGGGICIKVVTPSKERTVDNNNPNPALKGRPMAGAVIMSGAVQDGADRWKGKVYNSEDGKTYSGWLTVTGKNEVKLEGCVMGFLCKSHVWRRVQ